MGEDNNELFKKINPQALGNGNNNGVDYQIMYRSIDEDEYEVTTFRSIVERIGSEEIPDKRDGLSEVPLTCLNCGYRSLFFDFVTKSSLSKSIHKTFLVNLTGFGTGVRYKNSFVCPKCSSTYVGYREEDIEDLIAELL